MTKGKMSFALLPLYHLNDDPEPPTSISASETTSSSQESPQKPYQLLPQNQFPEKCAVCRNPSIGYHYEVPSCSGCKTFFRRTIVDGKRFICTREGNCLDGIDPVDDSRRMCRACRFSRCVETGMNPAAIRTAIKTAEGTFLLNEVVKKQKTRGIEPKMESNEDFLAKLIGRMTILDDQSQELHCTAIPLHYEDLRSLSEVLSGSPVFDANRIRNLTPAARKHLKHNCKSYMHSGLLATLELSKMFDFSSKLELASKMTLMKHVALVGSIMMTASFSVHRRKSDELLYPDGSVAGYVLDCMTGDRWTNYRQQLQKTLQVFLSNKVDRIEYMLLKAILMSNPAIPGLSLEDQRVLETERNQYGRALLDYCILQHGVLNGPARFGALLSINPVIEMQSRIQKDFYVLMKAMATDRSCSSPPRNMFDEVMDS